MSSAMDLISSAVDAADADRLVHGADERGHLVVVALRLEVRVGGGAVQRILGGRRAQLAAFLVEDGDAHAQRAEVDSCHYTHVATSFFCHSLHPNSS